MAVNARHNSYIKGFLKWTRTRTVLDGEDAVKAAGQAYLPKLSGEESDEAYHARKQRGVFFNATSRTLDGLHGYIWRKDPEIAVPDAIADMVDNATLTGVSIYEAAKAWSRDQISIGRFGILADLPRSEGGRPYLAFYKAEDIINWRTEVIDSVRTVTLVVLRELNEIVGDDGFETKYKERYRALRLTSEGYRQEIWEADCFDASTDQQVWEYVSGYTGQTKTVSAKTDAKFSLLETIPVLVKGTPVYKIPFVFANVTHLEPEIERSPLEDIVTLNLAHFRTSVDLEHGRHFTALPTPLLFGFDPKETVTLGSSKVLIEPKTDAHAEFLEFSGAGLASLEKSLAEKENQMAILGAKLLEGQKKAAEAAETVKLRQSGDISVLTQIVITLGLAFEAALRNAAMLAGVENPEVTVEFNTDFIQVGLSGTDLINLVQAWQQGGISLETMLYNLKKAEVIPQSVSVEMEMRRIAAEKTSGAAAAPGANA